MNREKRTRSLLLEPVIKPEPAAVSLNAAKEALLMPDKAHGMTRAELFKKAGVIINATGRKGLRALLNEKQIHGMARWNARDLSVLLKDEGGGLQGRTSL